MLNLETAHEIAIPKKQASPAAIFETLNRYQHTMALKGAIDLELFTQIADGATTPAAIAARLNAKERGVRILCDFLTVAGFLIKTEGTYSLTQDSALFLNKQSPVYMGTIANFVASDCSLASFRDMAALVRKGGALNGGNTMEPDNDIWVDFARSMQPIATMSAHLMAPIVSEPGRKIRVLDIAAGHGMFGIAVALQNLAAEIVAVDWEKVLEVAGENATRAGVRNRFHKLPGSAFEVDLGTGYDLVLISNFLHHFDVATNVGLLKKLRGAMNPGGRVGSSVTADCRLLQHDHARPYGKWRCLHLSRVGSDVSRRWIRRQPDTGSRAFSAAVGSDGLLE